MDKSLTHDVRRLCMTHTVQSVNDMSSLHAFGGGTPTLFVSIKSLGSHCNIVYLLGFYMLATSKVISGWKLTCLFVVVLCPDNIKGYIKTGDLWQRTLLATLLWCPAAGTWFPTQSQYLTSPCYFFVMLRLGSDMYQFGKLLVWLGWDSNPLLFAQEACALTDYTDCNRA